MNKKVVLIIPYFGKVPDYLIYGLSQRNEILIILFLYTLTLTLKLMKIQMLKLKIYHLMS